MRVNLPVTDTEYPIEDDTLILSTTDTKGRITFVNTTFIEVSGYSEDELIGKAHNIVRHPDMPPEAFDDLWKTLKAGLPWAGLVKNRRKNGDYYWVLGNATPIKENGNIVGYLSVRTKPSHKVIEKIAPIYRKFLDGNAHNLAIVKGQVIRTDLFGKIKNSLQMTTGKRLAIIGIVPSLLLACIGSISWWELTQEASATSLSSFIAATTFGSILLTLYIAFYVAKSIQQPIRDAIDFSNVLAAGDLKANFISNRTDEFGELSRTLNQLAVNLRTIVYDARICAKSVEKATNEIASGNLNLSRRTEQQAASLEETATSMKELAATVHHNSENSKKANELVISTGNIATKGGEMMSEVITTMSSISASSSRITNIINVIDDIAFQTNILSLNAAVEAAHAGKQGIGFAVVATEIRTLAQQSTTAAKGIKTVIEDSVKNIHSGTRLVDEADKNMKEIVTSIKQFTNIMSEITSASIEQSNGIGQINQTVSQMDKVTQQNAALVEQTVTAAESLQEQTKDLTGAISIFRVGGRQKTQQQSLNYLLPVALPNT